MKFEYQIGLYPNVAKAKYVLQMFWARKVIKFMKNIHDYKVM